MSRQSPIDPERVVITEPVPGSTIPVQLMYIPTLDGLYTPIGLRRPPGDGRAPIVLLASGNGGGGMPWVREAVRNRGYIMERLLEDIALNAPAEAGRAIDIDAEYVHARLADVVKDEDLSRYIL